MTQRENRNNEQLVVDENEETEEELEPPHEVITYVDQKALLRKQNFRDRSDDDANATTNATNERRKDGGEKERRIKMMNLDVNEGFQMGFQDPSSGFGLWGGGNESLEATATMTTTTTNGRRRRRQQRRRRQSRLRRWHPRPRKSNCFMARLPVQ